MVTPAASNTPVVTALVVTFNAAAFIHECLQSLLDQDFSGTAWTAADMRVVVVDNASTDGTADVIARDFPTVTVLRSPSNGGFAGGCALGFQRTRSAWVLLLNPDARADRRLVAEFLTAAHHPDNSDLGALTGHVVLRDRFSPANHHDSPERGKWRMDPLGHTVLVNSTGNVLTADAHGTDRGWLVPQDEHQASEDVFGFCGCAALLRRAAVDQVGGFDKRLFMYYEDTDLSWRLRLARWQIRYCAEAKAVHRHAASSVEGSDFFIFYNERNRLVVLTKNAPGAVVKRELFNYLRHTVGWLVGEVARLPASKLKRTRIRVRAGLSYLGLVPYAFTQRRRTHSDQRRNVANRYLGAHD